MNYRDREKARSQKILKEVIQANGNGLYGGNRYEFVLEQGELNLWDGIRDDALDYFKRNSIVWSKGQQKNIPTGHLFSSQVACVNHLYFIRQRKDIATEILKNISEKVEAAKPVDDGYVEFETIGKKNYLNERSHTRGANCTSVDAMMIGRKKNGKNILFLIEWKYTEKYSEKNKYIPERYEIYDKLLGESECPIVTTDYESLYYEPFYQLMRQTLLGWKMVQAGENQCDEYQHIHVIPDENMELKGKNTSPKLSGDDLSRAWKSVLKEPTRYKGISPKNFINPAKSFPDTDVILTYLDRRYWNQDS
jgi:hypothetical protein